MTCEYTYCKRMLGSLDPQSLNSLLYEFESRRERRPLGFCVSFRITSKKSYVPEKRWRKNEIHRPGIWRIKHTQAARENEKSSKTWVFKVRKRWGNSGSLQRNNSRNQRSWGKESKDISIQSSSDRGIFESLYPNIYVSCLCVRRSDRMCHSLAQRLRHFSRVKLASPTSKG